MNKFTLLFKSKTLEKEYQAALQLSYNKVFKLSTVCFMGGLFVNTLIQHYVDEYIHLLYFKISLFIALTSLAFASIKYPIISKYGTTFMNVTLWVFYINLQDNWDHDHLFIFAQNFAFLHASVLISYDFCFAAFNNLSILVFRLSMCWSRSQSPYYFGTFLATASQILLLAVLYQKCNIQRKFFLLSKANKQQNLLLTQITSKPLFIFKFSQDEFKFVPIQLLNCEFLQKQEAPLTYFLRACTVDGVTLEKIFFDLYNAGPLMESMYQFEVKYRKKVTKKVSLYRSDMGSLIFYLLVDNEDKLVAQYYKSALKLKQKYQNYVWRFINQAEDLTEQVGNMRSGKEFKKLGYHFKQLLLLKNMSDKQHKKISISRVIRASLQQYQAIFQGRLILAAEKEFIIRTQPNQLIFFIMNVLRRIKLTRKRIDMELNQVDDKVQWTINAKVKPPSSSIYMQIQGNLIERIITEATRTTYEFLDEPNEPFASEKFIMPDLNPGD